MKSPFLIGLAAVLFAIFVPQGAADELAANDPGWPRIFKKEGKQLTVYQPEVDSWTGFTNLQFRCAVAVKGVSKEEAFGVVDVQAQTVTDQDARTVTVLSAKRETRFGNTPEPELSKLRAAVDELYPPGQLLTIALDRVLAYLDPKDQPLQRSVDVNLNPPKIFCSSRPAVLVIFMGQPQFRPVSTNRTDLEFALNTNWDILFDVSSREYYLLNGDGWLKTADLLRGPWAAAERLPASIQDLPPNENWSDVKKNIPGKSIKRLPTVYVTTEPAEMILLDGLPKYEPIPGTKLQRAKNTASTLFLHTGDQNLYYLVAGRWFRSSGLSGPWTAATLDLPRDFAEIPGDNPSAVVKVSVPGTTEAQDAVLLASIPKRTIVNLTNVDVTITYSGEPKFVTITNSTVQYAVNSPNAVFLVDSAYYACSGGAWFTASKPVGPWTACTNVPPAVYSIPPSHPMHNVTYVTVEDSSSESITYAHTAGYDGAYVSTNGVVMFGTGLSESSTPASQDPYYYYYWYWYPWCYTYGVGASYYYYRGGFYGGAYSAYGPYGGAGYTAAYNPYTGTYARAGYAYGPNAAVARGAAYNPYTGGYAAGTRIDTGYGSAGRAVAYNPMTDQGAVGASRSGQYGSAAAVKSTQGSAVGWNTANGQGVVAKSAAGNVYAAKDGTVYRQDNNGNWWQNSGGGWQNASQPQPGANRQAQGQVQPQSAQQQGQARAALQQQQAAEQRQNLERQAQARRDANLQASRANQYRAAAPRGGAKARGGGRR